MTAVFISNCAAAGTEPAATISSGCSQEDLPALIIEVPPYLSIELAGVSAVPVTLHLSPLRRDQHKLTAAFARAQWLDSSGETVWLSGTLRIDRLVNGVMAMGHYDFTAPGGRTIRGDFNAVWKRGNSGCG